MTQILDECRRKKGGAAPVLSVTFVPDELQGGQPLQVKVAAGDGGACVVHFGADYARIRSLRAGASMLLSAALVFHFEAGPDPMPPTPASAAPTPTAAPEQPPSLDALVGSSQSLLAEASSRDPPP